MNFYEILEVSQAASAAEVSRAYRQMQHTYESDSLALHSLFGERDASVIRERIEQAYHVLGDAGRREEYDCQIGVGIVDTGADRPDSNILSQHPKEDFMTLEEELGQEGQECDGSLLRRARISAGFELEDISEVIKVSVGTLRHIEADNYADLPATVYVRGFVTGYAQTIGLDPDLVVPGYVELVEKARADQGRSRFLGRR